MKYILSRQIAFHPAEQFINVINRISVSPKPSDDMDHASKLSRVGWCGPAGNGGVRDGTRGTGEHRRVGTANFQTEKTCVVWCDVQRGAPDRSGRDWERGVKWFKTIVWCGERWTALAGQAMGWEALWIMLLN